MEEFTVVLSPSLTQIRLLATHGTNELVRACLPPRSQVQHRGAIPTLLEGLALIFDARPHVVLSAGAEEARWCLGLTDWDGVPLSTLYYDVQVVAGPARRPRGRRLRGVGDFADLQRLRLVAGAGA